jgi:hypothetical protein
MEYWIEQKIMHGGGLQGEKQVKAKLNWRDDIKQKGKGKNPEDARMILDDSCFQSRGKTVKDSFKGGTKK